MPRGRPREFDVDKALDRALRGVLRKGYEGASLPDLTPAMGINRPSLYAAFGNKEGLFRKVLDRYAEGPAAYVLRGPGRADGPRRRRTPAERGHRPADRPAQPAGLSAGAGALACGEAAESVRRELAARRAAGEAAIRARFERARDGRRPAGRCGPRGSRSLPRHGPRGHGGPGRGRREPRGAAPGRGVSLCWAGPADVRDPGADDRVHAPADARDGSAVPVANAGLASRHAPHAFSRR